MLQFLGERVLEVLDTSSTYFVFNDDGTEVLIAKTPIKVDFWRVPTSGAMSWNSLHHDNLVFGNTVVEIGGSYYTVSLLRGCSSNPTLSYRGVGYNTITHQGSEWNRYMYPIHSTVHTDNRNVNTSDMGTLAQYTDYGNGGYSWCQEVYGVCHTRRAVRGGDCVTHGGYVVSTNTQNTCGWSPILTKLNF